MTGPAAAGVRLAWEGLPHAVRAAVEGWLGSPVVAAVTQTGGFSPGVAARLTAADGRQVFVKAVSSHPNKDAPRFHRREAIIAGALPAAAPAPRLLWSYDEGGEGWIVLVFEDVEGQQPAMPWEPPVFDRVMDAVNALAASLTPSPLPEEIAGTISEWLGRQGRGWRRLLADPPPGLDGWSERHAARLADLEAQAPAAATGDTLLHFDIRADNLLLTPERVFVVDWPHARLGQAWVDVVFFAPSVRMQGGPSPESLLVRSPAARAAAPEAVSAVIAAVAGFFTFQSLLPPPPGLPTIREFQAAQGQIARTWLAERTNWA